MSQEGSQSLRRFGARSRASPTMSGITPGRPRKAAGAAVRTGGGTGASSMRRFPALTRLTGLCVLCMFVVVVTVVSSNLRVYWDLGAAVAEDASGSVGQPGASTGAGGATLVSHSARQDDRRVEVGHVAEDAGRVPGDRGGVTQSARAKVSGDKRAGMASREAEILEREISKMQAEIDALNRAGAAKKSASRSKAAFSSADVQRAERPSLRGSGDEAFGAGSDWRDGKGAESAESAPRATDGRAQESSSGAAQDADEPVGIVSSAGGPSGGPMGMLLSENPDAKNALPKVEEGTRNVVENELMAKAENRVNFDDPTLMDEKYIGVVILACARPEYFGSVHGWLGACADEALVCGAAYLCIAEVRCHGGAPVVQWPLSDPSGWREYPQLFAADNRVASAVTKEFRLGCIHVSLRDFARLQ